MKYAHLSLREVDLWNRYWHDDLKLRIHRNSTNVRTSGNLFNSLSQYGKLPPMHADLPIPDQQISDGHRDSSQAVMATPSSERKRSSSTTSDRKKRTSSSSHSAENESKSTSSTSSAQRSPRPRPKSAHPGLAAGVAAILLDPTAGPSSSRKGKGESKNNEVNPLFYLVNDKVRVHAC